MRIDRLCRNLLGLALLVGTLAASSACAAPRGRLYVRVGPPGPIVETRIAAPGPGYVWVQGYHTWNGSAYVCARTLIVRRRARAVRYSGAVAAGPSRLVSG